MSLVIRILHCHFIVYYIILGVHQLIDWPSLVYSPWLWDMDIKCKSSTRFMCLIINHFVMYYSNPQVNYMVTVFIRLVIAVYTLHLLSCSKCFVCLCLFQYRHCFLVGWCTNKSYSNLWLVTLHPCFQPASPQFPIPTPLQPIISYRLHVSVL